MALGNCLNALSRGIGFVPYRNSKLTRILKSSLTGEAIVNMIVCINPCEEAKDETLNSLIYA